LPVIGVGVLAQGTGLRPAALTFAAVVAALAVAVLVLLGRQRASDAPRAAASTGTADTQVRSQEGRTSLLPRR
jgi:hypothetical protein